MKRKRTLWTAASWMAALSLQVFAATGAEDVVTLFFDPGVKRLDKPIVIKGATHAVIAGKGPGRTILSGARKVDAPFVRGDDGVWRAPLRTDGEVDLLFIDGRRMDMARFPNRERSEGIYGVWRLGDGGRPDPAHDPLAPARTRRWKHPHGAYLHALHRSLWGDLHYVVKGVEPGGRLQLEGGWQNNRQTAPHPRYRFIENVREELDAPGEWFHDRERGTLEVIPFPGQRLEGATVEYASLATLLRIEDSAGVTVSNIVFSGTARTFMRNREPMFKSDWTLCREAAVEISRANGIQIADCDFTDLGGNAVVVNGRGENIAVTGSLFRGIGANGVVFAGLRGASRLAKTGYCAEDLSKTDWTPGPASDDYPRDCLVEDCLFRDLGIDEKQTAGVSIFAALRVTVRNCTICRLPRAGINIGTGTFGGHVIEGCDVFDTVLETGDHGSFNSWGRERYWQPNLAEMERVVAQTPSRPRLDALETTLIRRNRWRCDHGWDIDLDDGSSYYLIEDNLCLAGGLKLREGYGRIVRGNYTMNNTLHPHCWPDGSHDIVTNNVFFGAFRPAGRQIFWGAAVTPNTYARIDNIPPPPSGPWGVVSPRLKAFAGWPRIDPPRFPSRPAAAAPIEWRGMKIRAIDPLQEFSAFGTLPDEKGFVVEGDAKEPFREGDLILGEKPPPATGRVKIVRNQQRTER